MAGEIESPHPTESIAVEDGQYILETLDANGTRLARRPITLEEALRFLNQLVALHGADNVPWRQKRGTVRDAAATRVELRDEFVLLLDAIWRQLPGDDVAKANALAEILRRVVTQPEAIRLLTEWRGVNPAFWRHVWPDLEQRLATPPEGVAPGSEIPIGLAEAGASRAIEGASRTGPGGVDGAAQSTPPVPPAGAAVPGGPVAASGGTVVDAARAADPVLPFSGQLLVEATDLEMDGIGLDFALHRTYLHGVRYFGPLGPGWDHSYDLWLREALEPGPLGGREHVVYRATGALRTERFRAAVNEAVASPAEVADAHFAAPDGTVDRLVKRGGRFVAITPEGGTVEYNEHLQAEAIRDANGNELRLTYAGDPPRLAEIVDTCGRRIRFEHDPEGRLRHVVDTALDRHIWYGYDEAGRLHWVRKSVDAGRSMLTASYRYWGDGAPSGLAANLVALADGRGVEVLQVRYGDEPGLLSYNRVIEQRDGGVTRFDYEFVAEPGDADRLNAAVLRVRMTLPTGDAQLLDYNAQGRLVRLQAEDRLPQPRTLTSRWRYNADGNVVQEERADGSAVAYVWGREVFAALRDPSEAPPEERARFGQLRRIVEHRRPGAGGPLTRVTEYDYEPVHGRLAERRGPYYADALAIRTQPGPPWAARFTHDARGSLTSVRLPDCTLPDGAIQQAPELILRWDARGRLLRRDVPLEGGDTLATEYRYASANDPFPEAEIMDPEGRRLERRLAHDRAGRAVAVEEPTGLRAMVALDHLGRVLREETREPGRPVPAVTLRDWGALALPERIRRNRVDAGGREDPGAELIEEFTFDAEGDVEASRLRSADGTIDRTVRYRRGPDRRLAAYTAAGVTLETRYDARGRVIETWADAGGQRIGQRRHTYDAAGRIASTRDASGHESRMGYDGFGRLARLRHASGTEERFEWDAGDRPVRHRVLGAYPGVAGSTLLSEERRAYDEIGRLVRRVDAVFDPGAPGGPRADAVTTITHDRADRVIALVSPDGVRRTIRYDGLSRPTEVDDGVGTVMRTTFDDRLGERLEELTLAGSGPAGAVLAQRFVTRTRTDARGRVVARIDGLGNTTTHEYDSRGARTSTVDPAGFRTEYEHAPDGRLLRVTTAVASHALAWSYRRDPFGRLMGIDGPRGVLLTITRDAFGRVGAIATGAASGRETVAFTYDRDGRVASATEASGVVTTYAYDPRGFPELVAVTPPAPRTVSARRGAQATLRFRFDGAGRLVEADDGLRPVTRRYDSRGLLLAETTGGLSSGWSYDLAGRPTEFRFPDGRRLQFERGPDGRLQRVTDRPPGLTAPGELLRTWPIGPGTFAVQDWRGRLRRQDAADAAGRLVHGLETRLADGRPVLELSQLADARGLVHARRIAADGAGETLVADLDPHGRIVRAVFDGAAAVDVAPLLLAGAAPTQADVDRLRAAVSAAMPRGAEEVRLDLEPDGARRELTRRVGGGVVERRRYDVDAAGRAVEIGSGRRDDVDGLPLELRGDTLRYDAWRRLARVERGGARVAGIAYDALGRIAEVTTPAGAWDLVHAGPDLVELRTGGAPMAQFVRLPGGPLVETGLPAAPLRALLDGQGSLVGLADSTGTVIAAATWDPFGERRQSAGAWPPIGPAFQGLLAVPGLALLLTPARALEPRSGAFLEPDPLGFPDGLNRRLYAAGNPLAFGDPSGLLAQPANLAGRPRGLGYAFGYGTHALEDAWYSRFLLTVAGAFTAFGLGIVDSALMLVDGEVLWLQFLASLIGWEFDYQARSGIGQAAQRGEIGAGLDVFRVLGQGIVETPGRLLAAAERGDYGAFGAEGLNLASLFEGGIGLAKGVAGVSRDFSLRVHGRLGRRAPLWREALRREQLNRLQAGAARRAGIDERVAGQPRLVYQQHVAGAYGQPATGRFNDYTDTISISEAAFRPFSGPLRDIGTYQGTGWRKWRWEIGNVLRGNYTLRVLAHENYHRAQFLAHRAAFERFRDVPYPVNPSEFSAAFSFSDTPPPWALGAWDFEMLVPAGPLATGLGALGMWLTGWSGSRPAEGDES